MCFYKVRENYMNNSKDNIETKNNVHTESVMPEINPEVGGNYGDMSVSHRNMFIITGSLFAIIAILAIVSIFSVPKYNVESSVNQDVSRSSYTYDEKSDFKRVWKADHKYKYLVNTPGAVIAGDEDSVSRIDIENGNHIWSYKMDGGKLCHVVEANGNVAALFDNGRGCTDIVTLDAASGRVINQAQYSIPDDSHIARLAYGRENIAIVSPTFVRLLRYDLVPIAEFGTKKDVTYTSDQSVRNCDISDVAVGPDYTAIGSKCEGDYSYHVRVIQNEPKESTQGKISVDVDTSSQNPVTIPLVTKSMFNFVTDAKNPSVFAWQLDKEKSEVSNQPVQPGQFSYGYTDMKGIGYVWRIGDTVHARHGSEDISKSKTHRGAIGNPIQVDSKMIVPQINSVYLWDAVEDTGRTVNASGLNGKYFAFAGNTLVSLDDDGNLIGYAGK